MYQQHCISPDLCLTRCTVTKAVAAVPSKPAAIHRILVIDVSGSMSYDLPMMRKHLKANLTKCAGENDTVTIIWFSGRNQCGILMEGVPVRTLTDLRDVERQIDRWLSPVGLTGFKEPLELVTEVQERLSKATGNNTFSLFFLSDGYDNQWGKQEILKAAAAIKVSAATVVEYGLYADRNLLAQIAATLGGEHILSESFVNYEPVIEASLTGRSTAKRIDINLLAFPVGGFAYSFSEGQLLAYAAQDGLTVSVPEDVGEVYYLLSKPLGFPPMEDEIPALYAAVSLFATRMQPDVILPILRQLGDVSVIKEYSKCFGKQRYGDLQERVKLAVFDPDVRYMEGFDQSAVPADDAYTILEFVRSLGEGDSVLLDHPEFNYNKISRGRVDVSDKLTDKEVIDLQALVDETLSTQSVDKAREVRAFLDKIVASKHAPLKFVATKKPEGYPVLDIVTSEDRANISIRVVYTGTVDLTDVLPDHFLNVVPLEFPTQIYRTYNLIVDGLVNVSVLPMKLSDRTLTLLKREMSEGRLDTHAVLLLDDGVALVKLEKFPIINRQMVKAVSAKELFELEFDLTVARAKQAVLNYYHKKDFTRASIGLSTLYGVPAMEWLAGVGLTDRGFAPPKTEQAAAQDEYIAKELRVKLKGYSTKPKVEDVIDQHANGRKINAYGQLMVPMIDDFNRFIGSEMYKRAAAPESLLEAWLLGEMKAATAEVRRLLAKMAMIKFSIIVGQVWFTEFASLDDDTLIINIDGQDVIGTVEMKEIKVKI